MYLLSQNVCSITALKLPKLQKNRFEISYWIVQLLQSHLSSILFQIVFFRARCKLLIFCSYFAHKVLISNIMK